MDKKQRRKELEARFESVDTNSSGSIDYMELRKALSYEGQRVSTNTSRLMVRLFDSDSNGRIDIDEFSSILTMVRSLHRLFTEALSVADSEATTMSRETALKALESFHGDEIRTSTFETLYLSNCDGEKRLSFIKFMAIAVLIKFSSHLFESFTRGSAEKKVDLMSFMSMACWLL
eukprot:gnl/Dysnectes_brevis/745_a818_6747.p1 GENE.gnl/Dysnectes_brevis/745_a818_6747~~gnl/Dysnectes_brevis/745_a818_6747.p1  ORF type:complete len:175 (+),score=38.93 gnl/Dysnectes_brevis/745_a818_6747:70-594(+)